MTDGNGHSEMKRLLTQLFVLMLGACAYAGSPYIAKVYDYRPAPGQFVNVLPTWLEGETEAAVVARADSLLRDNRQGMVCLGAWGGSIVFGFDHTVWNVSGAADLEVLGNAFLSRVNDAGQQLGSSEPGIVFVSRDANGNGLPDDTWYEIAGSEYAREEDLTVTYLRPANAEDDIQGIRSDGDTIIIRRNVFHQQPYYPEWLSEEEYTLTGRLLPSNQIANASYDTYLFAYGYADNWPNGDERNFIDLDRAVNADGSPARLHGIDFVRVQTGIQWDGGSKGEGSTEITGARDLHPDAAEPERSSLREPGEEKRVYKTLREGRILIHRGGQTYDITGNKQQ